MFCDVAGSVLVLLIAIIIVYLMRRIFDDNYDWEPA